MNNADSKQSPSVFAITKHVCKKYKISCKYFGKELTWRVGFSQNIVTCRRHMAGT